MAVALLVGYIVLVIVVFRIYHHFERHDSEFNGRPTYRPKSLPPDKRQLAGRAR